MICNKFIEVKTKGQVFTIYPGSTVEYVQDESKLTVKNKSYRLVTQMEYIDYVTQILCHLEDDRRK